MLVSVQDVTKGFLDDTVLRDVSLEVHEKDRIGLLGVNGAGKTTLLNMIAGLLEPDEGQIIRARNLEIGYLQQNDALMGQRTLDEEAHDAFSAVMAVQEALDECCRALEKAPQDESLLAEYDRLHTRLEAMDAYHIEQRINRVLGGLGFGGFDRDTLVATLSGGEKMRFAIAKMLLRSPGLLILDEPTNHLDFSMLSWLEEYLSGYPGAVLTVSHDRYFLDKVAQSVCEIERGKLTRYSGGYSGFVQQKAERRRTALRAYEKQQEEIAQMEEYVRKNLARSASASSVGSRVKALEKMERLAPPLPEPKTISLRFDYEVEPFSVVLQCEKLGVRVGDEQSGRQLYTGLDLEVRRGEKIALVGLNGVGKSTFLKAIQNQMPHEGLVRWGGNVRLGYFDQELAGLPMDQSVLEAVHSVYPTKTEHEIRSALGRMLIGGEDVFKKVGELSGANRAKVEFTILLMRRANVLLLDEPTNHLDYRAKEALEGALREFTGTLIAVSHDRYFLRRVPGSILELHAEGFVRYDGNYDDYLAGKEAASQTTEKQTVSQQDGVPAPPEKQKQATPKQRRAAEAQKRNKIRELEQEISRLESALEAARKELEKPENSSDYALLAELGTQIETDTAKLDQVSEEWLQCTEGD